MNPITLSDFRIAKSGRFWLVTGSDGETYAISKKNVFRGELIASLAQKMAETKTPVIVNSHAGWYYRSVSMIFTVEAWAQEEARVAAAVAKWAGPSVASGA